MDSRYRTIRKREGRGLAGHSMGGYGTLRVGMKYPDVFAAIYAASSPAFDLAPDAQATQKELARMTPDMKVESRGASFSNMAKSAAWTPNPQKPPFYFDLPFDAEGKAVPLVPEKWAANSPLLMVEQNVPALKRLRGVALTWATRMACRLRTPSWMRHSRGWACRMNTRSTKARTATG